MNRVVVANGDGGLALAIATGSILKAREPIGRGVVPMLAETDIVADALVVFFDGSGFGQQADTIAEGEGRAVGSSVFADLLAGNPGYRATLFDQIGLSERGRGIEVGILGWFDGEHFARPVCVVFEERRFMPGSGGLCPRCSKTSLAKKAGVGSMTECQGAAVKPYHPAPPLFDETLARLTPSLAKTGYEGFVGMRLLVGKDVGVQEVLFGFPAGWAEAVYEGLRGDITEDFPVIKDWLVSVCVSAPPFPHGVPQKAGAVIGGICEANIKHVWPRDAARAGKPLVSAGISGRLGYVTAWGAPSERGSGLREARRRAYRTVGNLKVADIQYRHDIGARAELDTRRLERLGLL